MTRAKKNIARRRANSMTVMVDLKAIKLDKISERTKKISER